MTVIVLVPGAFHRPACWNTVAQSLRAAGCTVITPSLAVCADLSSETPESPGWKDLANKGPVDDAEAIREALTPFLNEGQEVVMVSHSYGSLPATLAVEGQTVAERAAKDLKGGIKAVVVIAGFAYGVRGKSIMGDESEPPLMPYHILEVRVSKRLQVSRLILWQNGIIHLQESAKALWYSDLTAEQQDTAWADLFKQQSRKSFLHFPQFIAADIKVPKTYVFTEQDQAVVPAFQEMSIQAGQFDNVVRLPSGHTPLLSMPDEVAKIILDVDGK
jgi:pimeloyl-ACP methyl ester carboxylesterase